MAESIRKRSQNCYNNKIKKITDWYNHIINNRSEKNSNGTDKKPLRPLEFYTDKVKKVRE